MIAQWLSEIGNEPAALLLLLVAGHVFGDFLLQTEWMAGRKERHWGAMLAHVALVFVAHLVLLWPFLSASVVLGVLCLSVLHLLFDTVRSRALGKWGGSLAAFFTDQALHLLAVFAIWRLLLAWNGEALSEWSPSSTWLSWYARWAAVAAAYVFNAKGATRIVRGVLERFPKAVPNEAGDTEGEYEMGRTIGNLERYLLLTLVLFGQWVALGFIIAAKSIARFPELTAPRHKDFAEDHLIGTLTSVLVALASGMIVGMIVLWR